MHNVIEFIHSNIGRELSLSMLARIAGVSPHHFSRLFKDSTGLSPHQYVLRQRIERAQQYLQNMELTIGEISGLTGFATPEHFSKVFRRFVGVTATEFRSFPKSKSNTTGGKKCIE